MGSLGSNKTSKLGLRLLLCPLGSNIVVRTACCSAGVVLPLYSTIKAIENYDQKAQKNWLLYWAAYGSFTLVEAFADKLKSWVPMYYHVKFAFLVWLQLPSSYGALQLYKQHLRPFFLRHQAGIELVGLLTYGELVGLRLLLCPLGSNVVIQTACCSVGVVLPLYSTFNAIENKDQSAKQKWLIYWAAYGSFSLVETFIDKLFSWVPMYHHMKFAFLVWLQLPFSEGALQLYETHLRPFFWRHCATMDQLVGLTYDGMIKIISVHQAGIKYAMAILKKITGSADQTPNRLTGQPRVAAQAPYHPTGQPRVAAQTPNRRTDQPREQRSNSDVEPVDYTDTEFDADNTDTESDVDD